MLCYVVGVGGGGLMVSISWTLEHLEQVVWVNEPWLWILCCVHGKDTLLSQCLSPPRCINRFNNFNVGR